MGCLHFSRGRDGGIVSRLAGEGRDAFVFLKAVNIYSFFSELVPHLPFYYIYLKKIFLCSS